MTAPRSTEESLSADSQLNVFNHLSIFIIITIVTYIHRKGIETGDRNTERKTGDRYTERETMTDKLSEKPIVFDLPTVCLVIFVTYEREPQTIKRERQRDRETDTDRHLTYL